LSPKTLDTLSVRTTSGEIFSTMDQIALARLVWRRFGKDFASANVAWGRMLETSVSRNGFERLINGVHLIGLEVTVPESNDFFSFTGKVTNSGLQDDGRLVLSVQEPNGDIVETDFDVVYGSRSSQS